MRHQLLQEYLYYCPNSTDSATIATVGVTNGHNREAARIVDDGRNICILCPLLGEWRKQRMEQGPVV
ncbi:MAG: hypothetical protein ABSB42_10165 [Tepidisphaeraceae bacterium]